MAGIIGNMIHEQLYGNIRRNIVLTDSTGRTDIVDHTIIQVQIQTATAAHNDTIKDNNPSIQFKSLKRLKKVDQFWLHMFLHNELQI